MSHENSPGTHGYGASSLESSSAAHAISDEIRSVVIFVGVIWMFYFLDALLPQRWEISDWFALIPRSIRGLLGIPLMPFMHASFRHLLSNTIPLFILLVLLAGSKVRSWEIVVTLILTSGVLVWLLGFARGPQGQITAHVGASGLIFALVGYLIASGIFEKRPIPLAVSVIVGLMFGLSTLRGLIPAPGVSWAGHFWGLIAGIGTAYAMTRSVLSPREVGRA